MSDRWMRKFRQGKADYVIMRPRPPEPTDDADMCRYARHFGWMIARSHEITKIIDELKLFGADQARNYDKVLTRRVDEIDRKHGLLPANLRRLR